MCLKKQYVTHPGWVTKIPVSLERSWSGGEFLTPCHSLKGINSLTWDPHLTPVHGRHSFQLHGHQSLPQQHCRSAGLQTSHRPLNIPLSPMIWLTSICLSSVLLLLQGEVFEGLWTWFITSRVYGPPYYLSSALSLSSVLAGLFPVSKGAACTGSALSPEFPSLQDELALTAPQHSTAKNIYLICSLNSSSFRFLIAAFAVL